MAEETGFQIEPLVFSKDELDAYFDQMREAGIDSPSNVFAKEIADLISSENPELVTYDGLRAGTAPLFDMIPELKDIAPQDRRIDDVGIMETFLVNPDGQPMRRGDFWKGFRGEIVPQGGSFAGAVYGAKAGAALAAPIPPVSPPTVAAKAVIPFATTILGAVLGQEGVRKVQEMITGEPDLIVPGTTPEEEAGKTAATVAGFLATPWAISKNIDLGAATYLNNVRSMVGPRTQAEMASKVGQERSMRFIAGIERLLKGQAEAAQSSRAGAIVAGLGEVGAGVGQTGAAYLAETVDPDDMATRIGLETIGAIGGGTTGQLLGPIANALGDIKSSLTNVAKKIDEEGLPSLFPSGDKAKERRLEEATDKIRELIEAAPEEDLEQVIRRLAELDPNLEGIELTAGAKTGSPVLLAVEEALNSMVPSVGAQRDQATDQAIDALRNSLVLAMRSGSREALRDSAELLNTTFQTALANRLSDRTEAVVEAFNRVGTERSNQELSQALFDTVDQQLDLARGRERELWNAVESYDIDLAPGEVPSVIESWQGNLPSTPEAAQPIESALAPLTRFIKRKVDELGLGEAAEGEALSPSLQQALDGIEPGSLTSTELIDMRSTALSLARKLSSDGDFTAARIAGDFAGAALADLEKIADPTVTAAYQGAREYSRALNDVFTRGLAGDLLATSKTGAQRKPPELLAQELLRGGSDPVQLRFNQIQEIGRFGLDNEFAGAAETVQDLNTVYEAILRSARQSALIPGKPIEEGGKINVAALNRWMEQNADLLDQFPALRSDLSNLNTAQTLLTRTEVYNRKKAQEIKNTINFQNLLGKNADSPAFVVARALSSGNAKPLTSLNNLARVANNAPADIRESAQAGLRSAVMQWAMESAGVSGAKFDPEVMNLKLFGPIPKSDSGVSVMDWMKKSGLISAEEAQRTQQILVQMTRYKRAANSGALDAIAEESGPLFDLFLRIAGAKIGTLGSEALGGGSQSLIAAGAGSRAIRNIFSNMPNALNMDVMAELIRDPKLLADMLAKPPKNKKAQQSWFAKKGQSILDWFKGQGISISRRPAPTAIREYTEELFQETIPMPEEQEAAPEVMPPEAVPSEPTAPEPRTTVPEQDALWSRVLQQESGNRQVDDQGQVVTSKKGALGVAQVMPPTAARPGYGAPSIFDVARKIGVEVKDVAEPSEGGIPAPTIREASRLLGMEEVNEAFGREYFDAMYSYFGGDPVRTLIAYNAGPTVAQQYDGDISSLPAETQNYLVKILGVAQAPAPKETPPLAQAAPPPMPPAAPAPAPITPQSLQRTAQVLGPNDEIGMLASELMMRQGPA